MFSYFPNKFSAAYIVEPPSFSSPIIQEYVVQRQFHKPTQGQSYQLKLNPINLKFSTINWIPEIPRSKKNWVSYQKWTRKIKIKRLHFHENPKISANLIKLGGNKIKNSICPIYCQSMVATDGWVFVIIETVVLF